MGDKYLVLDTIEFLTTLLCLALGWHTITLFFLALSLYVDRRVHPVPKGG